MPGEVLVHSVVTGVCGSDTHAAHGRHPFIELPYHPGHEVVGVITGLGPGVDAVESVSGSPSSPTFHAGIANNVAAAGRTSTNLRFFGCGYGQGGMADYFTVPADRVHVIPDAMDYRAAALVEPLSTPVHAVKVAGDVRDKTVVILGAGTIGLLLLAVVRAHGQSVS